MENNMSVFKAEMDSEILLEFKTHAREALEIYGIDQRELRNGEHENILESRKRALLAYAEARAALFTEGIKPETIQAVDAATPTRAAIEGLVITLRADLLCYKLK